MSHFRQCDCDTQFLLLSSVDEWLPENHLARFVVDIVDQLDLSALTRQYRGAGSAAYHPSMLQALMRPIVEMADFEAGPAGYARFQ